MMFLHTVVEHIFDLTYKMYRTYCSNSVNPIHTVLEHILDLTYKIYCTYCSNSVDCYVSLRSNRCSQTRIWETESSMYKLYYLYTKKTLHQNLVRAM